MLYDLWALGRNIILVLAPHNQGIDLLVIPHYVIGEAIADHDPTGKTGENGVRPFLKKIVAGSKMVAPDRLQRAAEMLHAEPRHVELPFAPGEALPLNAT